MTRRLLILAGFSLLQGCASYKLGLPEGPPFRTIHIPPVANNSFAPQMQGLLTTSLREAFGRGRPVRIEGSRQDADATLEITVTGYKRQMATAQQQDTGQPASFYLNLQAQGTLVNNRTGEVYFKDRPFHGKIQSFGGDKLVERERQNLHLLARNLSREIQQEVTSTW
tara:strand:- start:201 stop:704 length:504 start_codon:yes stop_codon:yes gene_type:complete